VNFSQLWHITGYSREDPRLSCLLRTVYPCSQDLGLDGGLLNVLLAVVGAPAVAVVGRMCYRIFLVGLVEK
jgi:hypothetical protein